MEPGSPEEKCEWGRFTQAEQAPVRGYSRASVKKQDGRSGGGDGLPFEDMTPVGVVSCSPLLFETNTGRHDSKTRAVRLHNLSFQLLPPPSR